MDSMERKQKLVKILIHIILINHDAGSIPLDDSDCV